LHAKILTLGSLMLAGRMYIKHSIVLRVTTEHILVCPEYTGTLIGHIRPNKRNFSKILLP
jgi:hypothetical protein